MPSDYPASVHVAELLREKIVRGDYRVGAWMPAERDLAAEMSVSRPVVREAIARLAEQGLLERRPGCRPRVRPLDRRNGAAPINGNGAQSARGAIAAVIPQHPTYASAHAILRGINAALTQHAEPQNLTICDTHPSVATAPTSGSDLEGDVLERLEREHVAGIVLWHLSGRETEPIVRRLLDSGVPVVFVDRHPASLTCDYVGVDNEGGVQACVQHLVELGHRRIAFVKNTENVTSVHEREAGYRAGLIEHGIEVDPARIYGTPEEIGVDLNGAADYLASLRPRVTAAIVMNDLHAFELMRQLEARGLRVPEDISVVGFDDIECYSPHPAMLTTVHQPFFRMGQRAARLLLRRIEERRSSIQMPRQHILLPTRLVVRSTTGPAAHAAVEGKRPGK